MAIICVTQEFSTHILHQDNFSLCKNFNPSMRGLWNRHRQEGGYSPVLQRRLKMDRRRIRRFLGFLKWIEDEYKESSLIQKFFEDLRRLQILATLVYMLCFVAYTVCFVVNIVCSEANILTFLSENISTITNMKYMLKMANTLTFLSENI